jgi:ribosomal protein L19
VLILHLRPQLTSYARASTPPTVPFDSLHPYDDLVPRGPAVFFHHPLFKCLDVGPTESRNGGNLEVVNQDRRACVAAFGLSTITGVRTRPFASDSDRIPYVVLSNDTLMAFTSGDTSRWMSSKFLVIVPLLWYFIAWHFRDCLIRIERQGLAQKILVRVRYPRAQTVTHAFPCHSARVEAVSLISNGRLGKRRRRKCIFVVIFMPSLEYNRMHSTQTFELLRIPCAPEATQQRTLSGWSTNHTKSSP